MPVLSVSPVAACFAVALFLWLYSSTTKRNKGYPSPPGPKALPIIGNLLDMPRSKEHIVYREWSRKYGSSVVHVSTLGGHLVIVNSARAADDLFNKRSSLYSDRPVIHAVNDIMGFQWLTGLTPYGPLWRRMRRAFHVQFHREAARVFEPIEEQAVHRLLREMLTTPNDYYEHLRHLAGFVIMRIAYGIEVERRNDPNVKLIETAMGWFVEGTKFSALIFDMLPILRPLPAWFPGAGFKGRAKGAKQYAEAARTVPWEITKSAMAEGTASPSVASALIQTDDDIISKSVPGTMYMAGADTTVSSTASFILAMVLNPEVQKKAHEELDSVLGGMRLPTFDDAESLPYVNAIVKETLRWHPVLPLAMPHKLVKDDIYDGYFIPGGSTVQGNVWAILHDPDVFPDPESFQPEHWIPRLQGGMLPEDVMSDFPDAAFGFGRRVCPGRHMAHSSMWLTVASLLAAFEIQRARDGQGKEIDVAEEYNDGMLSYPAPFRCEIKPRSEAARGIVLATSS